jgi:hypothetical protein
MTRLNSDLTIPSHCLVYCVGLLYDADIKHRIKSYTSKSLTRNQVNKDWLLQKEVNTFGMRSDIFTEVKMWIAVFWVLTPYNMGVHNAGREPHAARARHC